MQLNISSFTLKIPLVSYTREDFNVGTLSHIFILLTRTAADGSTIKSSYHFVLGLSLLL